MKKRFLIGGLGALVAACSFASTGVAAQGGGGNLTPAAIKEAESRPTPKRANGVPDFTGLWVATPPRGAAPPDAFDPATGNYTNVLRGRSANNGIDFERDAGLRQRIFPREARPYYKPSAWEQVRFNDVHGHSLLAPDPAFLCMPNGVPRIGAPQEIVQTDRHMIFIYPLHIRRIYIDGRDHPPESEWLGTWFGHSVGKWEGDTLVISTVDFNGQEWLGWPGWHTSPDKRVIERVRRVGNTLTWEAEVIDPLLLQPWKTPLQRRMLNTDKFGEVEEALPCVERDLEHMVSRERG